MPYCCGLRSFLLVRKGTNNAETYVVVLAASVVEAPAGNLAVVAAAVVAAATVIAEVAVARVNNIPTPLTDITAHVVESIPVAFFCATGCVLSPLLSSYQPTSSRLSLPEYV